jgi:hypothetical protein
VLAVHKNGLLIFIRDDLQKFDHVFFFGMPGLETDRLIGKPDAGNVAFIGMECPEIDDSFYALLFQLLEAFREGLLAAVELV